MHWLATLNGNSIILDNLDRMNSPHFQIFQDSDDHQAEQFFLRSDHFKDVDNADQVYSSTRGLIELVNGASAIQWGFSDYIRRGSIKLDELYYSKAEYPTDADWTMTRVNRDTLPSNPFIGKPEVHGLRNPFKSKTTGYIELCIENEDVFNILRQVSIGLDWRNLYCIWDTICHYSGGVKETIKKLKLDEKQIKAFTGTVNNFSVLGVEARHGVMGYPQKYGQL